MDYLPIPNPQQSTSELTAIWRVRLEIQSVDSELGLEINGDVLLGRLGQTTPGAIDLTPYGAPSAGVSRHHARLRPSPTHLFAIDLGSTNGTWHNGRALTPHNPTRINNNDVLRLGDLQIIVHIDERPSFQTTMLSGRPSIEEALSQIAKAVTSHLDLDEVLNQVAETAMVLSNAGETSIWLVDEQTGELKLEAQRGLDDTKTRRKSLSIRDDNMVGKVFKTGKSLRARRQTGDLQIKVQTDYLVEALVYVPIILSGITLGVLAATHREPGRQFTEWDEKMLGAIGDFAAIAIQNARLYEATDLALARRVQELTALNEVSRTVSASLDLNRVYDVLVQQVNKHWPVETVQLFLRDEEKRDLHPLHRFNNGNQLKSINKGIIYAVTRTGKPIVTNNVTEHPDYVPQSDNLSGQPPVSMVCVPLKVQDNVVGVLALANKENGNFTNENVRLLEAFANPVATAIQNARLFQESERQRRAIQATAHTLTEPLLILDQNGQLLIANEAAQALLDTHMAQLFGGISGGIGRTTEVKIGENTYLSTAQHLKDVGTIIVMQDITYVKQLEHDRAEFMRALSHDLKSPLTSIRGFAQLLERVMPLNEKAARFVDRIVTSVDRMLDMINQLLQVARSEEVELERGSCNFPAAIEKILNDLEGASLFKEIKIDFIQDGTPYPIWADETRIYHLGLNLIDNAIKYSPKGTNVHVLLSFNSERVLFQVRDEGNGIPEEDLEHVFDRYYRGIQAQVQPTTGTGVGLSVVKEIAVAHGGQAQVRNHPDGGAEFTIILPADLRLEA